MYKLSANLPNGTIAFSETYSFNLCKPAAQSCRSNERVWGFKVHNNTLLNEVSCSQMSGKDLLASVDHQTLVNEDGSRHVQVTYKNGDMCPFAEPQVPYSLRVEVKCNKAQVGLKGPAIDQSDRCSPRFVYES